MSCEVWARLQFNIVPDDGSQGWFREWQFNNIPVVELRKGFRFGDVQFNNVPVVNKKGNKEQEERVGMSNDEWKFFLVGMVTDCNKRRRKTVERCESALGLVSV
jgi:hypothetical protein